MENLGNIKPISLDSPLVSICILTYQHSKYISECLNSVLNQKTDFSIEIILGEDDSTDGTREICMEYAARFPEIIKLFLRFRCDVIYINGYPTGRFNLIESVKAARGKYVALLEGDDYWTDPFKLQKQVDILEKESDVIVCHHWQRIKVEGKDHESLAPKVGYGYNPNRIATVEDIFANRLRVKTRCMMFRNIVTDDFFPEWYTKVAFGDVPLNFLLGKYGKFYFIDEEMAVYRITGNGVSSAGSEKPREIWIREHYFNWIQIWLLANDHYNGKYKKQAYHTIVDFYMIIIKESTLTFDLVKLIFSHALSIKNCGHVIAMILFRKFLPVLRVRLMSDLISKAKDINERF